MKRRDFIGKTSSAIGAIALAPGILSFESKPESKHSFRIREYRPGRFIAPVKCVSPDDGFYLHTFYDVCPLSPNQQFLALTKLPYQGKAPIWGEEAEICIVDLLDETIQTIYRTKGWSFQMGANLQWSQDNVHLYANDIIDERPVCVKINRETGETKAFAGAKYDISPDEKHIISPNLLTMNIHQYGYAVPDRIYGKPDTFNLADMGTEGLWQTNLDTNERKLLVKLNDFLPFVEGPERDRLYYQESVNYLFHSKYNKQGTKISQVFRGLKNNKGRDASLFTFDIDGNNIKQCLSREKWNKKAKFGGSGNHPNWHPDGQNIVMNCVPTWLGYDNMQFCQFKYDGSDFKVLSEQHLGSGHPSINLDSSFLLSDTYPKQEWVSSPAGEIPIRLIDLRTNHEQMVCSIGTNVGNDWKAYKKGESGSHYKLDPHPVWSRDYKKVVFNGAPEGRRQVYLADLSKIV
ncbi:hypothetical protein LAG90_18030 [Marinilongibacter aquaticus]|uniref:hypothetical protein n=1 Tax=Marinilongibacter aquaticus TaxID=2975157 RepID=UPI0021BDACCD|nr:hypothetical protein [Marinilongibacter aquaticus]UBM58701.1 hypothetical protein LAG90_18030 [Marinilongibacter aquaticus]